MTAGGAGEAIADCRHTLLYNMYMKWIYSLYAIMLFVELQNVHAQQPMRLTLQEAVALARTSSVEAQQALAQLRSSYWSYRSYRADLLPEVSLSATMPSYSRSYSTYQESTGAYTYVKNDYVKSGANINISQNLWFTGGTLTLTSSLEYLKQLSGDRQQRFMTLPVAIRLNQPILGVNNMKWRRRIEPLRYSEAKANFLTATEQVTMETIRLYFGLLLAQENVLTARQNFESTETLLEAGKVKRKMGQISENELMQLELERLKARSTLTSYESSRRSSMYALRTHLAIEEDVDLEPVEPDMLNSMQMDYGSVLDKAMANHSHALNIRRRQLQADYSVAQARGNMRKINLYAQIGYTGTDQYLGNAYGHLASNQQVEVGLTIPLLDWGKRKGNLRVAQSDREVTKSQLRREEQQFRQDLFVLVEQCNNQREQLAIAMASDTLAMHRYNSSVQTFMIGRISMLDLNDARQSKDAARQSRISELYRLWHYYYQLRSITLWDWERNEPLEADFDLLCK